MYVHHYTYAPVDICDCLSKKPEMFAYKLKFILLPQLIATLLITMHVHCLHWLMLTGQLSLCAFCRPYKSMTGEMAPKEGTKSAVVT